MEKFDKNVYAPMADGPVVIAHRGGRHEGVRENSLEAFTKSRELMIDAGLQPYAEADITFSSDGIPYVFHGANTPNKRLNGDVLSKWEFERLSSDTLSRNQGVALQLDELLGTFPDMRFLLDMKNLDLDNMDEFLRILKENNGPERIIVGVRKHETHRLLGSVALSLGLNLSMIQNGSDSLSVTSLFAIKKNAEAKERWNRSYADSWLALKKATAGMIRLINDELESPAIAYANRLSSSEEAEYLAEKGFNAILTDDVDIAIRGLKSWRKGRLADK